MRTVDLVRRALHGILEDGDDPYAGTDVMSARRVVALLWGLSAAAGAGMLPLAPPTVAIGAWGWAVALALAALGLITAYRVSDRERAYTFDHLLAMSYAGVVAVAAVQWLAGGRGQPYQELLLVLLVAVVAVQRPVRAAVFMAAVAAAAFLPLLYEGWDPEVAANVAANTVLWIGLAVAVAALMASIRAQRRRLRLDEREARQLALVDGLTGLGNRRAMEEALAAEVARTERMGSPLSITIVDMDGLKAINDRFGHLEGDDCLRQVAVALRDTVRTADRCFRWAGDEFVILLPDTPEVEARRVCGRLSTAVRRCCADPAGEPLRVTCGWAQLGEGQSAEDLMRTADHALIVKKRAKRRRQTRGASRREAS